MQIVYMDENERYSSGEASEMDVIIYTGRISEYLEREH